MGSSHPFGESITIDVVKGGFILTYPVVSTVDGNEVTNLCREVFVSPRKLNQKLKEVIEAIGLVSEEK